MPAGVAQSVQWLSYRLDDRASIPGREFLFAIASRRVVTHPAFYLMGTESKATEAWSLPLPPSSNEDNNTSTLQYVFM
jgi:hypothetical protein